MAKNLICPHCGAEVKPGIMDCPYCHQSMFLSMSQIKAKEDANLNPNRVVTVDEYMAKQQQMQYQQQLNQNMNQPMQQQTQLPGMYDPNTGQPIQPQQMIQQVPIQTLVDPNTGQQATGYYDPYSGQWVTIQQAPQQKAQGQSTTVLIIALIIEIIGFFFSGGLIFGIIALLLCSTYKGEHGIKTAIKVMVMIQLVILVLAVFLLFTSFIK